MHLLMGLLTAILILPCQEGSDSSAVTSGAAREISVEQLQARLKSIGTSEQLDEATRTQQVQFLNRAIELLKSEKEFRTRLTQLKGSANGAA